MIGWWSAALLRLFGPLGLLKITHHVPTPRVSSAAFFIYIDSLPCARREDLNRDSIPICGLKLIPATDLPHTDHRD